MDLRDLFRRRRPTGLEPRPAEVTRVTVLGHRDGSTVVLTASQTPPPSAGRAEPGSSASR